MAGKRSQFGAYNRYFSMGNIYLVSNTAGALNKFSLAAINTKATVLSNKSYSLKPYGSIKLDLSKSSTFKTTPDSYGTVALTAPDARMLAAQSIRLRTLGDIMDYAMPAAVR
ncbi:MAG: hypothetical protein IT292_07170 [Deltaproteobacteria bacterium]|nr:hypothetical protein [Deltaproteobacteria bacterium]